MLCKVTHHAEHVLASSRPHQLHLGTNCILSCITKKTIVVTMATMYAVTFTVQLQVYKVGDGLSLCYFVPSVCANTISYFPTSLMFFHIQQFISYSGELSRKKTLQNFQILQLFAKVFSTKFVGVASFGGTSKQSAKGFSANIFFLPICECFLL